MLQSKAVDVRLAVAMASAQAPVPQPSAPAAAIPGPPAQRPQHTTPTTEPSQQAAARQLTSTTAPVSVPTRAPLTVTQIEQVDPLMREYAAVRDRARDAWETARERGLGDRHPEMERLRLQWEKAV